MSQENWVARRWYQSGPKLLLAGFLALLAVSIIGFGILMLKYWWEIKNGRGLLLGQEIYSDFSVSTGTKSGILPYNSKDLETTDSPLIGNQNSQVTIVEFIDFKCSNSKAEAGVIKKVMNKYGDKAKLIVRNFPAESIHPGANQLAQFSVCAYEQGLYWLASDWLFERQADLPASLSPDEIKNYAQEIGMDPKIFLSCMQNRGMATKVNRDYADGFRFGVRGTPTFFINGEKIEGVVPWEAWQNFFENKLPASSGR